MRWRRPLFGRLGCHVVAAGCGYELAALCPGSPLPPITAIVRRWPPFGVLLLLALAHHLLFEEASWPSPVSPSSSTFSASTGPTAGATTGAVPSLLTVTVGFTTIDSYPLSVSSFVVCADYGANHR